MPDLCPECGASFGDAAGLVEHTQSEHQLNPLPKAPGVVSTAPRWIRCALCGARFRTPQALAAHNREPHRRGPPIPTPRAGRAGLRAPGPVPG